MEIKYRRKQVPPVNAIQWVVGLEIPEIKAKTCEYENFLSPDKSGVYDQVGIVDCIQGKVYIRLGDWLLTDQEGNKTVCPNHIFKEAYEQVIFDINES